ncbi:metallophosphoesterase [Salinibacillus xinjiangensis]|uniref:Metallophosphoesterase n=2 Tax=Salinibacillus xinjiangensis TaxID=1229268 RepID=A0A6G1X3T0_9BACI|nr:metallophosphoesterase [Salinibacillus xinjiangensis]
MTRRSFLKRFTYGILGTLGLSGGTYYYSKHLEPTMLSIKEDSIFSPKLPPAFENFKILQFGDTHLGFHYDLGQFEELIQLINEQKPDLVLFNGDLVDEPNMFPQIEFEACIQVLSKIKAPFGKYWVYGNHDHGGYGTETLNHVMELSGFKLLKNESLPIQKDQSTIQLAGLDDVMLGRPDLEETFKEANPEQFTILMCHEPDFADHTVHYPVDIQFSGHSHGGQIQIPFLGYLVTPPFAEKYVEGKYQIGSRPLQLFVTRGIGTTRLPFRFLCKPEINIYSLQQNRSEEL